MITILIAGWGVYFIKIQRGVCFFWGRRDEVWGKKRRRERERKGEVREMSQIL